MTAAALAGRVDQRPFASRALAGNALGDPSERNVAVYLPPGSDAPGARFPTLFLLSAFTGHPSKFLDPHPWSPGVVVRYDRAVAAGELAPAIVVMPDCFTWLGGSQYVDSSATGAYESYLCDELVPWVDATYPTRPDARGVCGTSSGGFGALHLALHRPGLFHAVASLSGDVAFELCFGSEILGCLRGLVAWDGDPARFLAELDLGQPPEARRAPDLSGDGHAVLNVLAMAACYSPDPAAPLGFELPMDLATGELVDAVWQRWLAFDPLRAVETRADALRALELLYLECGLRDEFHLQWGLRRFARALEQLGVAHEHVEHAGGHRGLDARLVPALGRLASALARA